MCLCFAFFENKWYFIVAEITLLGSMYLGFNFFYIMDKRYSHLFDSIDYIAKPDTSSTTIPTGNKKLDLFLTTYNNMIQNLREERLRLEGQGFFLEELISVSPIGIIITDFDGKISDVNKATYQILDIKIADYIGQLVTNLLPSTYNVTLTEQTIVLENHHKVKLTNSPIRYKGFYRQCIMIEDLTSELYKTEKEAYGQVIRMMSHEVNNSTGAVNSILQSLLDFLKEEKMDNIWQEAIEVAIDRNKNLGQFVVNFASVLRVYNPNLIPTNLSKIANKVKTLWQFKTDKQIKITINVSNEDDLPILIDEVQIEQVIHNIVKNAYEAILDAGTISIYIGDKGKYLCITDDGIGLTEHDILEIQSKPFYTTKPSGQGIGLTLIREILMRHEAQYKLTTGVDKLTRFEVFFK